MTTNRTSWRTTWNPFGPEPVDPAAAILMQEVIPLMRSTLEAACPSMPTIQPKHLTYQHPISEGSGRTLVYLYTTSVLEAGDSKDAQKHQPTPVAYKRLAIKHPELAANAMMLAKEAILLHRLRHKNIVRALGMVYEEATAGVLVEYFAGGSLRTLLLDNMTTVSRSMYSTNDALRWCLDMARALAYCHSQGVLHRDVNPNNVMLTSMQRGRARAKVVDFGFHKLVAGGTQEDGTHSRPEAAAHTCPVGAIMYMAPEVWRGQPYSTPADVFSWACLSYEILTGTLRSAMLFADTATQQQLATYADKVAGGYREAVPGVAVGGGEISPDVWGVVERCWAPDASKRPSMDEVVGVLEAWVVEGEEEGDAASWCSVM